jgi:hypothetical protein
MKRLALLLTAALALLLPAGAAAKGPSEAQITGPGLDSPLKITGVGEGDASTPLGVLVSDGGFFPQTFGGSPSGLLRAEPGDLGSRYLVTYTVPGPALATLQQELYPYAAGGPVTFMRPGQTFWGEQRTVGGWSRGTPALKAMLIEAGLPKAEPAHRHFVSVALAILRRFLP